MYPNYTKAFLNLEGVSPSLTTTRERGVLPKMGAKNATDFQKSVALLFGAVFNFSLPFPLLGKRKGQPILAVL